MLPPPPVAEIEPQLLSARELREQLELLFDWLHGAEMKPDRLTPEDGATISKVRDAANALLAERRLRHSDEPGTRGG